MADPDGLEQRSAWQDERAWADEADFDRIEDRADNALMDLAAIRINELSEECL